MDLAELGIVYISEGAEAAINKLAQYSDAVYKVIESDEDRVKAANKAATSTQALSDRITQSIISYQGAKSAQFEFAAIALGANEELSKQINLLKRHEEYTRLMTEAINDENTAMRAQRGYLLDLAKDHEILAKAIEKENKDAQTAREKELASREAYYSKIISDARTAEQQITDAKHKAIVDQQNERDRLVQMYTQQEQERVKAVEKANAQIAESAAKAAKLEEGLLQDVARDNAHLSKVRAKEAQDAQTAREKELASREAYYSKIIADAKAAEQAITDAKHKAIVDQMNERDRLVAMYTKDEQERVKATDKANKELAASNKKAADDALKDAEHKALSEIAWAKKSRDEQLRIKAEIAAYRAGGVSEKTIAGMVGPGAIDGAVKGAQTLAEKWNQITFNTSRARSEMVVLAHEAVQGRFSRIPASMMVFAEYTDLTALAMSGLGLSIMGAVAALAVISIAMVKGILEQREMQNALILTGNFAGTTEGKLSEMAHSAVSMGGSLATAKEVITDFARSGKFTAEQIATVSSAIVVMEHATGGGSDSVKMLVQEFKSLQVEANAHSRYSDQVTKAVLKLDSQYHFLTTTVLAQIRAFEDEGKQKEASALATNEYARVTKERSQEIVANLGYIERGWRSIKEAIGEAWSAMKDWGKSGNSQSFLQDQEKILITLKRNKEFIAPGLETSRADNAIAAQEQVVTDAKKRLFQEGERAFQQGERAREQSESNRAYADIEIERIQLKAGKQDLLTEALKRYHSNLDKLRKDGNTAETFKALQPDVIAEHEAALREKFRDKSKGKGASAAAAQERREDHADLLRDLQEYKKVLDEKANAFGNQQKVLSAKRSAGLIDEASYSKTLKETIKGLEDAQDDAYAKEIKRRKQETFTGKTAVQDEANNAREILKLEALKAKAKSDGATAAEIAAIQEQATLRKIANSYNEAAIAAQRYIDTAKKGYGRTLEGIGKGTDARGKQSAINQINDTYDNKAQDNEKFRRENSMDVEGVGSVFTNGDAAKKYNDEVELVASSRAKMLNIYQQFYDDEKAAQGDWVNGYTEALANYESAASNVAGNTAAMFTTAFDGITSGIASSIGAAIAQGKSLEDGLKSVAANVAQAFITSFIQIQIQKMLIDKVAGAGYATTVGAQSQAMVAMAGLNAFAATAAIPYIGPFLAPEAAAAAVLVAEGFAATATAAAVLSVAGSREFGGPVDAGKLYRVNERGPEMLSSGGEDFLMMGKNSGTVTPNNKLGNSGGGITIINQTSAKIGPVQETTLPDGKRAIIIRDAVEASIAAISMQLSDANSKTSRSFSNNYAAQRRR